MKLYLRKRLDADGQHATVWLLERSGPASSGLMLGVMTAARADLLLETMDKLGIRTECDKPTMENAPGETEKVVARQKSLFDENS